jgi:phosphoribosyl 1,2-cyclic phosphodiesterase
VPSAVSFLLSRVTVQRSRNIRNNPSALISYAHPDGRTINILIDCGKTFRSAVLNCFPTLGVDHIDALILTHAHADAFMGLDDLRDVSLRRFLPVYTSAACFEVISRAFSYLVTKPVTPGLHIASLDWRIIEPFVPFSVDGVVVVPLPLVHGPPEPMLGFEFSNVDVAAPAVPLTAVGLSTDPQPSRAPADSSDLAGTTTAAPDAPASEEEGERIAYLSDLAALPAETRAYLVQRPISLLVLDALSYNAYPTHFRFRQSVACTLDLRPTRAIFTGMNHNVDYAREDPKLRAFGAEHGLGMECGYDGWSVPVRLTRRRSIAAVRAEVDAARASWASVPPPAGEGSEVADASAGTGPPSYRYLGLALPTWEQGQGPASSMR